MQGLQEGDGAFEPSALSTLSLLDEDPRYPRWRRKNRQSEDHVSMPFQEECSSVLAGGQHIPRARGKPSCKKSMVKAIAQEARLKRSR